MRDQHQRGQTLLRDPFKNLHYILRIRSIKVPGRFIGQQHRGAMNERPRNCRPLHFASAQLMNEMFFPLFHSNNAQYLAGTSGCLTPFHSLKLQRHTHILQHVQCRQKMEKLEHDPQLLGSLRRQLLF
jgi:hypothetical protein